MRFFLPVAIGLAIACHDAGATPPIGGFAPIEQVVSGGCRAAETVMLVRVAALQIEQEPDSERRTATLEVVRVFKGDAKNGPTQLSRRETNAMPTDSCPSRLEANAQYVLFVNPATPWTERLLPFDCYRSVPLETVVALAESACKAPIHGMAPPDSSRPPSSFPDS